MCKNNVHMHPTQSAKIESPSENIIKSTSQFILLGWMKNIIKTIIKLLNI